MTRGRAEEDWPGSGAAPGTSVPGCPYRSVSVGVGVRATVSETKGSPMDPVWLGPNQPLSFYRGSDAIAAWRGLPGHSGELHYPEDWIASVTPRFGLAPSGLTTLPDGRLLADAIAGDPLAWLGPEHLDRWGADPRLLVKLLDAGERLPVHVHPDRGFAASHLASPYGKTEAWLIVDAVADAAVNIGFDRDIEVGQLAAWTRDQDVEAMLAATNRVPVSPGDSLVVPAGTPHSIGSGILLVELQEPSDFSIFLEWRDFDLDGAKDGHLGLGYDLALQCVNRGRMGSQAIGALSGGPGDSVFSAAADDFFRARRLAPDPEATLAAGYAVLVVLAGGGELAWTTGGLPIAHGQTILVPWGAGELRLSGADLVVIAAQPPL
jgi:mannose-6-phosphate isomerase